MSASQISIRIDTKTKERLSQIANRQKRTSHSLAAEALIVFIEQKEKEYLWNKSCIDSLNDFDETGLHVTQNEVEQWMDSWETNNELPVPICHI